MVQDRDTIEEQRMSIGAHRPAAQEGLDLVKAS